MYVHVCTYLHTWGVRMAEFPGIKPPSLPLSLSSSLPLSLQKHLATRNAESFVPTDLSWGSLGRSTLELHTQRHRKNKHTQKHMCVMICVCRYIRKRFES